MIKLSLLICLFLFNKSLFGSDDYKYFLGTNEPDTNWYQPGFDDSSWLNGHGSIGFGDGDDTINIDPVTSFYIRSEVQFLNYEYLSYVSYTENLEETPMSYLEYLNEYLETIYLYADFDDGFIAYLNGTEILRVHIDDTIEHLTNDQTTNRSHEALKYRELNRPAKGFYLNKEKISQCTLDSVNTFCFQVHNDSIIGSDMTFDFDFFAISNSYFSSYQFNLWEDRFFGIVPLDSSELPIIKITTDEYGVDEEGQIAHMGIINNTTVGYNKITDDFTDFDGRISIHVRGQSSGDFAKHSYKIETQDSQGNNENVPLLGMPAENDWILYAPYTDKSLIRNEIVFRLGKKMGLYQPRTRFCELVLDGFNLGLYILTEQIKRDNNRVDIAGLNEDDNSGIDLTGGYIFKFEGGDFIIIDYPKTEDITNQQYNYIHEYYDTYKTVLAGNDFLDLQDGYKKYIDVNSLIDYIIISEFTVEIDAYVQSCYMYKDRDDIDGHIKFGPYWDYDNSFGYTIWFPLETEGWRYEWRSHIDLERIFQDTSFTAFLTGRWFDLRENALHQDSVFNMIDSLTESLEPYISRNYQIWPTLGYDYSSLGPGYAGLTYEEEIQKMKNWVETRLAWIDDNIEDIYYPVEHVSSFEQFYTDKSEKGSSIYCYPNPFYNHVNIVFQKQEPCTIKAEILDITGRKIKVTDIYYLETGTETITLEIQDNIEHGIYILKVYKDNAVFSTQKIIKVK